MLANPEQFLSRFPRLRADRKKLILDAIKRSSHVLPKRYGIGRGGAGLVSGPGLRVRTRQGAFRGQVQAKNINVSSSNLQSENGRPGTTETRQLLHRLREEHLKSDVNRYRHLGDPRVKRAIRRAEEAYRRSDSYRYRNSPDPNYLRDQRRRQEAYRRSPSYRYRNVQDQEVRRRQRILEEEYRRSDSYRFRNVQDPRVRAERSLSEVAKGSITFSYRRYLAQKYKELGLRVRTVNLR